MKAVETLTRTRWFAGGGSEVLPAQSAEESEVQLSVNGEAWLTFRCSPDDLESLAVGFLYNEGFIESAGEVADLRICDARDHIDLWLNHSAQKPEQWSRTSGCQGGVVQSRLEPMREANQVGTLAVDELFARVATFASALAGLGQQRLGLHTSMLLDGQAICLVSSDIGRHNTLDKLAGARLMKLEEIRQPTLITTGRISSEMVTKAARMQVHLVISLHSASDMAIEAARRYGIILAGHARRTQVDIYTLPERIAHLER